MKTQLGEAHPARVIMMGRQPLVVIAAILACGALLPAEPPAEGWLMRFPDVHEDKVVFSYGGDLWLVSSGGGIARRITANPGLELFPKFSPDGKWIAYTGQYDGNFNVYVIPSEGGQPRQLTFLPDIASVPERMGPNHDIITWLPNSKRPSDLGTCSTAIVHICNPSRYLQMAARIPSRR